jgi:hypothetical protein
MGYSQWCSEKGDGKKLLKKRWNTREIQK